MKKICSKCHEEKSSNEFYKRTTMQDGLQRQCRSCMKNNDKKYYKKNKRKLIDRYAKQARERAARFYDLFKVKAHCTTCAEKDPCCLELHHIDPKEKDFTIADAVRGHAWPRIVEEMEKCAVLCRNCHTKVHKYGEQFVTTQVLHENVATKFLIPAPIVQW